MNARASCPLSFSTLGTPGRSVSELIELAQRFDLGGIDLRLADEGGELSPHMSLRQVLELGQRLRDAGLEVPSLYCYCRPEPTADRWQAAYRDELSRLLELGAAVGAGYIRSFGVPLAAGRPAEHSDELVSDVAAAALEALGAGPAGVGVVLQNHAGTSGALECAAIARAVSRSNFGLAYSPDHVVAHEPESVEQQVARVGPWTRILYVSDLRASTDAAGSVAYHPCLVGEGVVPLRPATEALVAEGFVGYVSLKWEKLWHPELPDVEAAMTPFVSLFRSHLAT